VIILIAEAQVNDNCIGINILSPTYTQRRQEEIRKEAEVQEQINQLLRELGKTEGELAALRHYRQNKGFWARLLGGE
jgi:hypothetical protein